MDLRPGELHRGAHGKFAHSGGLEGFAHRRFYKTSAILGIGVLNKPNVSATLKPRSLLKPEHWLAP